MPKVDGGELVARVMRENKTRYCFSINGGTSVPDPRPTAQQRNQAHPYASRAGYRLRRRRLCADDRRGRGVHGYRRMRADQRDDRALPGRDDQQRRGLRLRASIRIPRTIRAPSRRPTAPRCCSSFAKYTKRVTDWSTIEFDMRLAFREAITPPQGVALVEIPQNILYPSDEDKRQSPGGMRFTVDDVRSAGDPAQNRPRARVAGARPSGHSSPAATGFSGRRPGPELREFAELTSIPVYARRAGQGSVSEEHPLAVRGAFKKPFTGRADVVLDAGLPLLERRALRPPQDLERQGQIHPGRSDPEPHRMAGAGRGSARSAIPSSCCVR